MANPSHPSGWMEGMEGGHLMNLFLFFVLFFLFSFVKKVGSDDFSSSFGGSRSFERIASMCVLGTL